MKHAILISGIIGALLFFFSMYAFLYVRDLFKPVAYIFLPITILFFILNIIVKSREERERRRKAGKF